MPYQSEAELLAALRESDFWKYVQNYLQTRREALLLSDDAQTTERLWQDKGAVRELTRLFNLPNLIMAKLALDAQQRLEALKATPDLEDYDG